MIRIQHLIIYEVYGQISWNKLLLIACKKTLLTLQPIMTRSVSMSEAKIKIKIKSQNKNKNKI